MYKRQPTEDLRDFNRVNVMKGDIALKRALEVFDERGGLKGNAFRIDMRRAVGGGWSILFIYLPAAPDCQFLVKVDDSGVVTWPPKSR